MFAHAATTQTLSVAVGSLYNIGLLFDKRFRGFRGVQLPATCFEFPEIRFVVRVLLHAMARNQDRLATVSNMFKTIVKGDPRSAGDIEWTRRDRCKLGRHLCWHRRISVSKRYSHVQRHCSGIHSPEAYLFTRALWCFQALGPAEAKCTLDSELECSLHSTCVTSWSTTQAKKKPLEPLDQCA